MNIKVSANMASAHSSIHTDIKGVKDDKSLIYADLQQFYTENREDINDAKIDTIITSDKQKTFTFTQKKHIVSVYGFTELLEPTPTLMLEYVYTHELHRQSYYIYNDNDKDFIMNDYFIKNKPKDNIEFLKNFQTLINTTFGLNEPYLQSYDNLYTKNDNNLNITDLNFGTDTAILQLLLYRLQMLHQGSLAYINNRLYDTSITLNPSTFKILIFDTEIKRISRVNYLTITTLNGPFIIGKLITSLDITKINDNAICILELNFDFKSKSKNLQQSIIDYLIRIYEKKNSINVLQCLATKIVLSHLSTDARAIIRDSDGINNDDTDDMMLSARPNLGGSSNTTKHVKDITNFYDKDMSGRISSRIFKKGKDKCYTTDKSGQYRGHTAPYCTYNLLNYYRSELSNQDCEQTSPAIIIRQINEFYSDFDNIASNLFIVTDIGSIYKLFGDIGLYKSLDFILLTHTTQTLYTYDSITNEYKESNIETRIDILRQPYQNIYIILNARHENVNIDALKKNYAELKKEGCPIPVETYTLYDPPLTLKGIENMNKFHEKFKQIYKHGLSIFVSSYLSRSILTASLIHMAIPTVDFFHNDNIDNINYTLQIFMLILLIRHIKLGSTLKTIETSLKFNHSLKVQPIITHIETEIQLLPIVSTPKCTPKTQLQLSLTEYAIDNIINKYLEKISPHNYHTMFKLVQLGGKLNRAHTKYNKSHKNKNNKKQTKYKMIKNKTIKYKVKINHKKHISKHKK